MRRIALRFALSCIVMAMAAACSNEDFSTTQPDNDGKFLITAGFSREAQTRALVEYDAFNPTATTRVAYDDSKVGTAESALTWEEGDMLEISYFDKDCTYRQKYYTLLSEDAGKADGRFAGDEPVGESDDGTYTVTYVAPAMVSEAQQGDDNTSHLRCAFPEMLEADEVSNWRQVSFTLYDVIIKMELSNLPDDLGTIQKVTWKMTNPGLQCEETSCDISGITIDHNKTSCTLYLAVPSYEVEAGGNVQIILEGDKIYTFTRELTNGMVYEDGKRYTARIDQTADWKGNFSYTLVDNVLTLDVTPGTLLQLLKEINNKEVDNLSSITNVIIKGALDNNDIAKVDDFRTAEQPSSCALGNWLRFSATAVTTLDMSQVTGLTSLPENAFWGCGNSGYGSSSLSQLILPSSLRIINYGAFAYVTLPMLVLPEGVENIQGSAFEFADIKNQIIPGTITWLANGSLCTYRLRNCVFEFTETSKLTQMLNKFVFVDNLSYNESVLHSSISDVSILLPYVTESSIAEQVRGNLTSVYNNDPTEYKPTIYYGWKGSDYTTATAEEKCDISNYVKLE